MELLSDGKYVVFKVAEFDQLLSKLCIWFGSDFREDAEAEEIINSYAIPDSTVIRAQDIFSAPALYAYATAVTVAIRMMDTIDPLTTDVKNSQRYLSLKRLEEFFLERAEEAHRFEGKKLPD